MRNLDNSSETTLDAIDLSIMWDRLVSIADEIVRILVVRQCVVLSGKPVVETVIVWLRLIRQVEATV